MQNILKTKIFPALLILGSIALVLYIRVVLFPIPSGDLIYFVFPWYDFFVAHGFWQSLGQNFYNYNPPYLYLIGLAAQIHWLPKIIAIKSISVIFDFVAAAAGYKIVANSTKNIGLGWLTFFVLLLAPTIFIESGLWGQCDIIYTAFLLWMLFFLLQEKYLPALVFFSIAFVFKFQAAFVGPIILLLYMKKKLPLRSLWIPAVIYLLGVLPVILAGRPILEVLNIFSSQFSYYNQLSMNAPSIFFFFSSPRMYSVAAMLLGLGLGSLFALGFLIFRYKIPGETSRTFLYDACLLSFMLPFLLPKMHERYFFAAAVFFIILSILEPKTIWMAVLSQISCVLSFLNFLYGSKVDLTYYAFWINLVLASTLVTWYVLRNTHKPLLQPQKMTS